MHRVGKAAGTKAQKPGRLRVEAEWLVRSSPECAQHSAKVLSQCGWKCVAAFLLGAGTVPLMAFFGDLPVERDGYYHLAISTDYANVGGVFSPQIGEGVLKEFKADREFLFHIHLSVLLALGISPELAPLASCALALGAIAALVCFLSGSLICAMGTVFASSTVLFRMIQWRPHVWAVFYVLLGLGLLQKRRYRDAAIVNCVYSLSYSVPAILVIASVIHGVTCRQWKGIACVGGSALVAIMMHPHFPQNVVLLWYQGFWVIQNSLLGNPQHIQLPGELSPWGLSAFLEDSWLPLVLCLLGALRRTTPTWLLLMQLVFLGLSLRMNRLLEYWVPLVFLGAKPSIDYLLLPKETLTTRGIILVLFVALTLILGTYHVIRGTKEDLQKVGVYKEAALWLRKEAQGEYVFNGEWDAYAELRYFGGNFVVAHGQDPVFTAGYDPQRHLAIESAVAGRMKVNEFRAAFPARFVVDWKGSPLHRSFTAQGAIVRFEDQYVVILETSQDAKATSG